MSSSSANGFEIMLDFYRRTLELLQRSKLPFLVGGAYALKQYTEVERHTKDLDIFVKPSDYPKVMETLSAAGYRTEDSFAHWLGKAMQGDLFIDVIFSSGNGLCEVDDQWFEHAEEEDILGITIQLIPPEEMIWSKAFILERERYDGADIAHILRERAETLDWDRLVSRFGDHWRVLLHHLTLFGFIYPAERTKIPQTVMHALLKRLEGELNTNAPEKKLCRGTLLSRSQYLIDLEQWGYKDARLTPRGNMSHREVREWTEAANNNEHPPTAPMAE